MSSLSYYQYTTGGLGATTPGPTVQFKGMLASTRHLDRGGGSLMSAVLLALGQADQSRAVQPFDRAIRLLDDRDRSPFARLFGGPGQRPNGLPRRTARRAAAARPGGVGARHSGRLVNSGS